MNFIKKLELLFFQPSKKILAPRKRQTINELSITKKALHESAHGIVWYLFKENWIVHNLTISPEGLPDVRMKGALHISPNFNINTDSSTQRVNEISAIALAGMIGQNIDIIRQNDMIANEIMEAKHYEDILNITWCDGDLQLVRKYLSHLSKEFKTSEYQYLKYKIMDLIYLFQNHNFVQDIHNQLSNLLLAKSSISGTELIEFFEQRDFENYVKDENLDINFFHL